MDANIAHVECVVHPPESWEFHDIAVESRQFHRRTKCCKSQTRAPRNRSSPEDTPIDVFYPQHQFVLLDGLAAALPPRPRRWFEDRERLAKRTTQDLKPSLPRRTRPVHPRHGGQLAAPAVRKMVILVLHSLAGWHQTGLPLWFKLASGRSACDSLTSPTGIANGAQEV